MADQYDIEMEEGIPFQWYIDVLDDLGNSAIPSDTAAGYMQVRQAQDTSSTLVVSVSSVGTVAVDQPAGRITVTLPGANTVNLPFLNGVGYYDIVLANASGQSMRVLQGKMTYNRRVTP